MDIANLKVGNNTYGIKDSTARTNAQNAQSTANTANTNAQNANTKIDGSSLVGEYTSGTETLEISLEIGSLSNE